MAIDYFLESVSNSSSTVPIYDNEAGNDSHKGSALSNVPRRTSLVSLLSYSSRSDGLITSMNNLFDNSDDESDELDDELIQSAIASARITSDITPSSSSSSSLALLLPSDATSSALAKAYRDLAFQTLADQVRNSVRLHPGNGWMFDTVNVTTTPLHFIDDILPKEGDEGGGRGVVSRRS